MNKNLLSDKTTTSTTLDEYLKIKKEIKVTIPEGNWNDVFLLDLKNRLFKVLQKLETRINNRPNALKSKIVFWKKKEYKFIFKRYKVISISCCEQKTKV